MNADMRGSESEITIYDSRFTIHDSRFTTSAPVADEHEWGPIKWRAVFLARDHGELRIAHSSSGRCGLRAQQALIKVCHQICG